MFRERNDAYNFDMTVLPHLDAAFNFARWLTRNDDDAADIVQEACLRALKYFSGYRGGGGRAWFLAIVRNIFYTKNKERQKLDALLNRNDKPAELESYDYNPEIIYMRTEDSSVLKNALQNLPVEFREVIVLRELEGFSYKEISELIEIPLGTVMSRLSRGRKILFETLNDHFKGEA